MRMKCQRHIALILAGGQGVRMNNSLPKQYMKVDGETILMHTMKAFQRHALIHDIYIVCAKGWEREIEEEARMNGISKFRETIKGGKHCYESLQNGITTLSGRIDNKDAVILVHDAVRPLITQDIISRNIDTCTAHGNAITAISSHEAFAISKDGHSSHDYLPREGVFRAQTPHTFHLNTLIEMITQAKEKGVTESQSLFTLANELNFRPLFITPGNLLNFKLTNPEDIRIYQALKDVTL